VGPSRVEVL
jgi:hypothetical protein